MKKILILMLVLLGTAGFAQNNPIFGGGIGDGWSSAFFMQEGNNIYTGGGGDGWARIYSDVFTLAIEEQDFSKELIVYPNPTKGLVNVKLPRNYELIEVLIFNSLGQTVQSKVIHSTENFDLNILDKSDGIYFISIQAEGKCATFKILKE